MIQRGKKGELFETQCITGQGYRPTLIGQNLQMHEMVLCYVCCSVLALVVINALLYYQLTALESTVATRLMFDNIAAT